MLDVIATSCVLQKRNFKKMDSHLNYSETFRRVTPQKLRKREVFTTSPQSRHEAIFDRKFEDKGVGCDLFENLQINRTFQKDIHNIEQIHQKLFTPDIKVFNKNNIGFTVFKPIPRIFPHKTNNNSPKNSFSQQKYKRRFSKDGQVNRMKTCLEREKLFSDKNCRIYLNELLNNSNYY